ncbi:MAG: hypothetical protein NT116_02105 [Candidatus Parcubacteria bacterium]|nr:hypothetical protein [Candidatus Parcubacteria bacterium]
MPVQTRTQTKNVIAPAKRDTHGVEIVIESFNLNRKSEVKNEAKNIVNRASINLNAIIEKEDLFREFMMIRLAEHEKLKGQQNTFISSYEMMYMAYSELPDILRNNPSKWTKFAKTVYNKAYEFEYYTHYDSIEENIIKEFIKIIHGLRSHLLKLFKELNLRIVFENTDCIQDTGYIKMD